ncbi:protein-disulfide reductase DsbD family protein [Allomuricauda sp. SCSIO 65647]|uniref:protein-disulfide reductase DsbD family protein n=1 Tax=Allomuricauda sp. SCSIO 65647 TaxID=2908843 RepID=UPI001F34878E|nr:thioredoxin family protein [Muricauda sp. SCSIO 65647]UJH67497.1 thioredoxin family protein [Muricauda sp. SCSIO 65647]
MKRSLLAFWFLTLVWSVAFAQSDKEPVLWSHEVDKISDTEYKLVFRGKIAEGWHVYSQYTAEGGSLPSEFSFEKTGEDYELVGKTEESETITEYSDIFEVDETFFKKEAVFTQHIKLLRPEVNQITVNLFYQVCKEVCIPKDELFQISLDGSAITKTSQELDDRSRAMAANLYLDLKDKELLTQGALNTSSGSNAIWMVFGLGFLGGLIALLTPCVFPLIPLTVSFFTKHTGNRSKGIKNALLYGFFIVLIYFLLSLPFHLFDSVDSQILNTISTNVWLNLFFFAIFVFFAFSFFGYYELTLPNSWANKMDSISNKVGGGFGVFFMALTLAIVSFSCTGPILGGLLGSTTLAQGSVATNLSSAMTGFGLALALPFALFALFPAWLNSLPKSGGWMTTVKVVLGFLELALAFKFLSKSDLVGNWGWLKREIFVAVWILIFLLQALYLFGKIKFPNDIIPKKLGLGRLSFAILTLAFMVYLIPGLTNTEHSRLGLLSGILPPEFYSVYEKENDCPLGLECYKDFEQGLVAAKAQNKPILLDFTGWGCENCRRMEENVWSDPSIYPMLRDDYILISLYVDDRKELSKNEQFEFQYETGRIKSIKTIGQKWGTFQTVNFNVASQPYYVLLSPELQVLAPAVQYTDVEAYEEWLRSGLGNYGVALRR